MSRAKGWDNSFRGLSRQNDGKPRPDDTRLEDKFGVSVQVEDSLFEGWLLNIKQTTNIDSNMGVEQSALFLYFVLPDSSTVRTTYVYEPYFFIDVPQDNEDHQQLIVNSLSHKFEKKYSKMELTSKLDMSMPDSITNEPRKVIKISFRTTDELNEVRRELRQLIARSRDRNIKDVSLAAVFDTNTRERAFSDPLTWIDDIFEDDVNYITRACIDCDIRCGVWYSCKKDAAGQVEISKLSGGARAAPPLRVLAWDIETTKEKLRFPNAENDEIMMISYMCDGKGYLLVNRAIVGADIDAFEYKPRPDFGADIETANLPNERSLILTFFAHLQQLNPHVHCTYNGDFFDFPFVEKRCQILGINFYFGSGITSVPNPDGSKSYFGKWSVHMDCFCWVKRDSYLPQGSQGLKAVTRAKLKYDPVELDPELMLPYAVERPQELAAYSVSDAVATFYLYLKYIHGFIFALSTIIPFGPDDVLRKGSGTLCEQLLMASAYGANVMFPPKAEEGSISIHDSHPLEQSTYVGGNVEAILSGIYRADVPEVFKLYPPSYQTLYDNVENIIKFAVLKEANKDPSKIINLHEVSDQIKEKLEFLRDSGTVKEPPVILHLDVAAMYPNIILTNRLQPHAIVQGKYCSKCPYGSISDETQCQRALHWMWRGELLMANVSDMNNIVKQLEKSTFPAAVKRSAYSRNSTRNNGNESDHNKNDSDSDSNDDDNTNGDGDTGTKGENGIGDGKEGAERRWRDLTVREQNEILMKRLKTFSLKAYKRIKNSKLEIRENVVCQRMNDFYIETVRAFRDRRYDYKNLVKVAKGQVEKAENAVSKKEAFALMELYDCLQLAHKCILNSFYGYVMRKGARWMSMEMAGIVTYTGASIVKGARELLEKVGKVMELDTDGVWCLLPKSFPQNYKVKMEGGGEVKVEFPCSMLNYLTHMKYTNDQYQFKDDTNTWITKKENSIFFELDGPYLGMSLPASQEEGRLLKKRYAVYDFDGSISELKGFEIKRRGELKLIKTFQEEVFPAFAIRKENVENGITMERSEVYDSVATVANRWLDVLDAEGTGMTNEEIIDLLGESKTMSSAVNENSKVKSAAITCALRLSEIMGKTILRAGGLTCHMMIAKKPDSFPVSQRAIPISVFRMPPDQCRLLLRKWLRDPSLQSCDVKDVIDWSYYKTRLGAAILKIISIPAELQGVRNPVPRIKLPDWMEKQIAARRTVDKQTSLVSFFSVGAQQSSSHGLKKDGQSVGDDFEDGRDLKMNADGGLRRKPKGLKAKLSIGFEEQFLSTNDNSNSSKVHDEQKEQTNKIEEIIEEGIEEDTFENKENKNRIIKAHNNKNTATNYNDNNTLRSDQRLDLDTNALPPVVPGQAFTASQLADRYRVKWKMIRTKIASHRRDHDMLTANAGKHAANSAAGMQQSAETFAALQALKNFAATDATTGRSMIGGLSLERAFLQPFHILAMSPAITSGQVACWAAVDGSSALVKMKLRVPRKVIIVTSFPLLLSEASPGVAFGPPGARITLRVSPSHRILPRNIPQIIPPGPLEVWVCDSEPQGLFAYEAVFDSEDIFQRTLSRRAGPWADRRVRAVFEASRSLLEIANVEVGHLCVLRSGSLGTAVDLTDGSIDITALSQEVGRGAVLQKAQTSTYLYDSPDLLVAFIVGDAKRMQLTLFDVTAKQVLVLTAAANKQERPQINIQKILADASPEVFAANSSANPSMTDWSTSSDGGKDVEWLIDSFVSHLHRRATRYASSSILFLHDQTSNPLIARDILSASHSIETSQLPLPLAVLASEQLQDMLPSIDWHRAAVNRAASRLLDVLRDFEVRIQMARLAKIPLACLGDEANAANTCLDALMARMLQQSSLVSWSTSAYSKPSPVSLAATGRRVVHAGPSVVSTACSGPDLGSSGLSGGGLLAAGLEDSLAADVSAISGCLVINTSDMSSTSNDTAANSTVSSTDVQSVAAMTEQLARSGAQPHVVWPGLHRRCCVELDLGHRLLPMALKNIKMIADLSYSTEFTSGMQTILTAETHRHLINATGKLSMKEADAEAGAALLDKYKSCAQKHFISGTSHSASLHCTETPHPKAVLALKSIVDLLLKVAAAPSSFSSNDTDARTQACEILLSRLYSWLSSKTSAFYEPSLGRRANEAALSVWKTFIYELRTSGLTPLSSSFKSTIVATKKADATDALALIDASLLSLANHPLLAALTVQKTQMWASLCYLDHANFAGIEMDPETLELKLPMIISWKTAELLTAPARESFYSLVGEVIMSPLKFAADLFAAAQAQQMEALERRQEEIESGILETDGATGTLLAVDAHLSEQVARQVDSFVPEEFDSRWMLMVFSRIQDLQEMRATDQGLELKLEKEIQQMKKIAEAIVAGGVRRGANGRTNLEEEMDRLEREMGDELGLESESEEEEEEEDEMEDDDEGDFIEEEDGNDEFFEAKSRRKRAAANAKKGAKLERRIASLKSKWRPPLPSGADPISLLRWQGLHAATGFVRLTLMFFSLDPLLRSVSSGPNAPSPSRMTANSKQVTATTDLNANRIENLSKTVAPLVGLDAFGTSSASSPDLTDNLLGVRHPIRSFILRNLPCGACGLVRDIDLTLSPPDIHPLNNPWCCEACAAPLPSYVVEAAAVEFVQRRVSGWFGQDAICSKCKLVSAKPSQSSSCDSCGGVLVSRLSRSKLIEMLRIMHVSAKNMGFDLLKEVVEEFRSIFGGKRIS